MSFKERFTTAPHLDSEGFVMSDARCWGCAPNEPCSRSGSCERYDSPLRYTELQLANMAAPLMSNLAEDERVSDLMAGQRAKGDALRQLLIEQTEAKRYEGISLTGRQMTLVRVALMQRLDRLKHKPDCQSSYNDTRAMLETGGVLALDRLRRYEVEG